MRAPSRESRNDSDLTHLIITQSEKFREIPHLQKPGDKTGGDEFHTVMLVGILDRNLQCVRRDRDREMSYIPC